MTTRLFAAAAALALALAAAAAEAKDWKKIRIATEGAYPPFNEVGPDGKLKWVEQFENIVVNEGLNHLLDSALAGQTQITSWYVGLKGSGMPAAADTMGSHATWSEDQNYSEANRPTWTPNGAASGQSVSNSNAKATFSINATTTIYGAFLTSNNTKGGTTGKLYAAGNFASAKSLSAGDQLLVTATFTTADDGV